MKKLADFSQEEQTAWADHPITMAVAADLREHRDIKVKAFMAGAGTMEESAIRVALGYHAGLSAAIHKIGGDA